MARLDAFSCDAICALRATGANREDIARAFRKKDGKHPHLRAADAVLTKHRANPEWMGGRLESWAAPASACPAAAPAADPARLGERMDS